MVDPSDEPRKSEDGVGLVEIRKDPMPTNYLHTAVRSRITEVGLCV